MTSGRREDTRLPARWESSDPPSFSVERQSFRRRRLVDAACALPLIGMILWLLPLLWYRSEVPVSTSHALTYIFGIWVGLVLVAARLVRLLTLDRFTEAEPDGTDR